MSVGKCFTLSSCGNLCGSQFSLHQLSGCPFICICQLPSSLMLAAWFVQWAQLSSCFWQTSFGDRHHRRKWTLVNTIVVIITSQKISIYVSRQRTATRTFPLLQTRSLTSVVGSCTDSLIPLKFDMSSQLLKAWRVAFPDQFFAQAAPSSASIFLSCLW